MKKKILFKALKPVRRFDITNESEETPYLIRWRLFGHKVKLHKFLRSDTDCMHDHPWNFISIILKGYYYEETPGGTKKYKAGSILFRKAEWVHRISIDKPCWSLVINQKPRRSWGFYMKDRWVYWRKYKSTGTCDN